MVDLKNARRGREISSMQTFYLGRGVLLPLVGSIVLLLSSMQMNIGYVPEAAGDDRDHITYSADTLIRRVAPAFFPIDPKTDRIRLPKTVCTVVIDIGARESDYLAKLEQTQDESIALFLFDPLPDSIIPLAGRVSRYATSGETKYLPPIKSNQVFAVRAAMGEEEGEVAFSIALGPACGSILQTSANNSFWCAQTKDKLKALVFTLKSFIDILPLGQIKSLHLKVDAEGADLHVLRGAKEEIKHISTIVIECVEDGSKSVFREDECIESNAIGYMKSVGFHVFDSKPQGGLVNIFFLNPNAIANDLPPFLSEGDTLTFQTFYRDLGNKNFTSLLS